MPMNSMFLSNKKENEFQFSALETNVCLELLVMFCQKKTSD